MQLPEQGSADEGGLHDAQGKMTHLPPGYVELISPFLLWHDS